MKFSILVSLLFLPLISSSLLHAQKPKDDPIDVWMQRVSLKPHQARSLHEAAATGDARVATLCLELGQPVNQLDELARTPLHIAVQQGGKYAHMVKLLLDAGADVMLRDAEGRLPIDMTQDAALRKLCQAAMQQREQQLNVIASLSKGETAPLQNYLTKGGDPNALDAQGRHAILHTAITRNNSAAVALLLKAGAKAERSADHGKNYLMLAASGASPEIVKLLLTHGANPLHQSNNGATALHDAVWARRNDNVAALLPAYKSVNYSPDGRQNGYPLDLALGRGNVQAMQLILEAGVNPNKPPYGPDLLIEAVKKGNADMVKALLKAGAKPQAKNARGETAMQHARGPIADLLRR